MQKRADLLHTSDKTSILESIQNFGSLFTAAHGRFIKGIDVLNSCKQMTVQVYIQAV